MTLIDDMLDLFGYPIRALDLNGLITAKKAAGRD